MDGAAFEETSDGEYRRIFDTIAARIANDIDSGTIRDTNGNNIGEWEITSDQD